MWENRKMYLNRTYIKVQNYVNWIFCCITHYLNTVSSCFDGHSFLSYSGTGWTSTTGSAGRWSEQSWRGRAGRTHWSGWSERPSWSPEDRLSCSPTPFSQKYWTIDCSAVLIVCIFLIFLCVSRSASFVNHIVPAVLLKIIKKIIIRTFLYLLTGVSFLKWWQMMFNLSNQHFVNQNVKEIPLDNKAL